MGRAPCCDKDNVKKGPWSPEEDAKLKDYIEKYGTGNNWIALPQKIGLKRCGKSCRLRWLNYLRPNLKHGGFSEEEDNIICSLYISIGSRWSIIAAQLPGRTDNDIKNYWNTRLKKKLLGRRKQSHNKSSSTNHNPNGNEDNGLSNSALERLQLHMHLQTLQNPFSFYNNPAMWPNLHPLQEKMIQTLQSFNQSPNPLVQGEKNEFYEQCTINNLKVDELENSVYDISSSDTQIAFNTGMINIADSIVVPKSDGTEQLNTGTELDSRFQDEVLDDFLGNKAEFDCFKEMDGSKDSMIWWSNDSNSWDSTSILHQSEGMYQDFALGYNMQ